MGRHGWILHTLARMLDWLRFRASRVVAAIPARIPGTSESNPDRMSSGGERERAAIAAVVDRVPPDRRLGGEALLGSAQPGPAQSPPASPEVVSAEGRPGSPEHQPDLPASFSGAERFDEPIAAGAASDPGAADSTLSDPAAAEDFPAEVQSAAGGAAIDRETTDSRSSVDTITFTPDPALDLVDDIEFSFEPEPYLGESTPDDTQAAAEAPETGAADLAAFADGGNDTGPGWVKGDGTRECPDDFPIKGNGNSHIYHLPGQASYTATIPELCFATEEAASAEGYRPTRRSHAAG